MLESQHHQSAQEILEPIRWLFTIFQAATRVRFPGDQVGSKEGRAESRKREAQHQRSCGFKDLQLAELGYQWVNVDKTQLWCLETTNLGSTYWLERHGCMERKKFLAKSLFRGQFSFKNCRFFHMTCFNPLRLTVTNRQSFCNDEFQVLQPDGSHPVWRNPFQVSATSTNNG